MSSLNIGPVTVSTSNSTTNNSTTTSSSTGDTPQYATSSNGLNILSKSGTLYNCTETSTACQAKSITRAEAAAVANIAGGMPLDSPNAYSDDDQNIFQKPLNGLPYFGIQVCFGGTPFQIQPDEQVSRDQFACLLIKSIEAVQQLTSGALDKYSDEGASSWTNEINVLAANDVATLQFHSRKICQAEK